MEINKIFENIKPELLTEEVKNNIKTLIEAKVSEKVNAEIKKIEIGKFFPKEDKLELDIFFNDGADKEIFKVVDMSDPENAAESILADLRKLEKNIHKNSENRENIVENFMNLVVRDEDNMVKEISGFIQKAKNKIDEIKKKNVAEGYLDMIRELKNLKLEIKS